MPDAPLKGIRVIELARVLAGPWAGQLLADLGADVIKVENPEGGDDTRKWGPPFVKGANGEDLSAAYYHSTNRGKRSIAIDLKAERGSEAIRRLAATSDVLIENFKTGGLAKYGLDYGTLRKVNPRLIYCSITGFGQTGPYANRAGYDFVIQAMSGMMSITGEAGREPQKAGVAISDIFTGLYSVIAIQAALLHRENTGEGQFIDMALFDSQIGVLGNQNLNYLVSGNPPVQMGNAHMNIAPYEVFPVADGYIVLAIGNDGQFRRFCEVVEMREIPGNPDFETNAARVNNRGRLREILLDVLASWPKAKLLTELEAAHVPASPINNIAEMFADPQAVERGMRLDIDDGQGTALPGVRSPILLPSSPLVYERPSPRLGEHTDEILAEIGMRNDDDSSAG
jgi:crotonobetainyl-CoA:carnitine CoA-transferase CaiB-like acyl-CoA transferase